MKKLIFSCAILSCATVVSFAQATKVAAKVKPTTVVANPTAVKGPSAETLAEKEAKAIEKSLKLSADQYKGVYEAYLEYYRQLQQMKSMGAVPGEGQSTQMRMGRDMKIQNAISADQYAKYQSMQTKTK